MSPKTLMSNTQPTMKQCPSAWAVTKSKSFSMFKAIGKVRRVHGSASDSSKGAAGWNYCKVDKNKVHRQPRWIHNRLNVFLSWSYKNRLFLRVFLAWNMFSERFILLRLFGYRHSVSRVFHKPHFFPFLSRNLSRVHNHISDICRLLPWLDL